MNAHVAAILKKRHRVPVSYTHLFDRVNDSIWELKSYTKAKAESSGLPDIIRSFGAGCSTTALPERR